MKNHSSNLHASIYGIFCLHSVDVARYAALIQAKSPANCDAHLAESIFQTRSRASSSCGRAAWTQGNEAFLQYRGFEVSVYSQSHKLDSVNFINIGYLLSSSGRLPCLFGLTQITGLSSSAPSFLRYRTPLDQ